MTPASASSLADIEVWVTESGTNTVSVFNPSTKAVTQTIVVGIYPHGIAITPDGSTAYVANTGPNTGPGGSQTVSVIDAGTYAVTTTIEVGEAPQVVAVSPDASLVAVTCADGVYVIATSGGQVTKSRVDFHNPHGVAFSPDGSQIWVADSERDQIVVLSAGSLRGADAIAVGQTPWNVAFSADGGSAYVTNTNEDSVSVVNVATRRQKTRIALPSFQAANLVVTTDPYTQLHHQPGAIAVKPGGRHRLGRLQQLELPGRDRPGDQHGHRLARDRPRRRPDRDRVRRSVLISRHGEGRAAARPSPPGRTRASSTNGGFRAWSCRGRASRSDRPDTA